MQIVCELRICMSWQLVQNLQIHNNDITQIQRFIEAFEEDSALHIVFEWASAGDLKRQIQKMRKRKSRFSERLIWKYFLQISEGLRPDVYYVMPPQNIVLLDFYQSCNLALVRHLARIYGRVTRNTSV